MRHARWFLLILFWLPSCTFFSGSSTVLVTSSPPGAEIFVDGEPTGSTTPCLIDMDPYGDSNHQVTLQKPGFEPEQREVFHYTTGYTSRWIDGADEKVISFPLWWTLGDILTPFGVKWQYVPHELHARLYPPGVGPVVLGSENTPPASSPPANTPTEPKPGTSEASSPIN